MEVKSIWAGVVTDINGATYTAIGDGGLVTNDETGEVFVISALDEHGGASEILPAGKFERDFYDAEHKCIVHEFELIYEFAVLKWEDPETYNYTFEEYLSNCLDKGGTLYSIQ